MIEGGYIIEARKIENSWVAHQTPVVRELWSYVRKKASFQDNVYLGIKLKRGQMILNISEIREDLSWNLNRDRYSTDQIKKAIGKLKVQLMLSSDRAPTVTVLTITNYDYYNDINNYSGTTSAPGRHQVGTPIISKDSKDNKSIICSKSNDFEPPFDFTLLSLNGLKPLKKKKVPPKKKRILMKEIKMIPLDQLETSMDYANNLAKYLHNHLKFKYPQRGSLDKSTDEWIEDMEKLIRLDKKNAKDIKKLISFYFNKKNINEWWTGIFASAGFLRRSKKAGEPSNFEMMFEHMKKKSVNKSTDQETTFAQPKKYLN